MSTPIPSSIAQQAAALILERDAAGQAKYGTSMDRTDLRPGQWLQHAIEEHADALQYQIKLRAEIGRVVREAYERGRCDALDELVDNHEVGRITVAGYESNQGAADALVRELLG